MEENPTSKPILIERSPLYNKAELLMKMLKEDQKRIDKMLAENKQDEISIEKIDEGEEEVIQMEVIPGIYEIKNLLQEEQIIPLDTTEMTGEWHKATEEPKKDDKF